MYQKQGLMIRMSHKGLRLKAATPIRKNPNDIIKLLVISGVVEFGAAQRLTKIGQGSFDFGENCPIANTNSITFVIA